MQFEDDGKPQGDVPPEKDVGGRPCALECTDETLKQISSLSRMQCSQKEAAAVMGVHRETFAKFLDRHQRARDAWEDGQETGRVSLRRYQYKMAEHNPTMAIWLGKNWLGQKDLVSVDMVLTTHEKAIKELE